VPDVVVRDVGYELDRRWDGCPEVLLSGLWAAERRAAAASSGAVCLAKPFTGAELVEAVTRASLSRRTQTASSSG